MTDKEKLIQAYITQILKDNPDLISSKSTVTGIYQRLQTIFLKDAQKVLSSIAKEVLAEEKKT